MNLIALLADALNEMVCTAPHDHQAGGARRLVVRI
jgi:hypothetical protein